MFGGGKIGKKMKRGGRKTQQREILSENEQSSLENIFWSVMLSLVSHQTLVFLLRKVNL